MEWKKYNSRMEKYDSVWKNYNSVDLILEEPFPISFIDSYWCRKGKHQTNQIEIFHSFRHLLHWIEGNKKDDEMIPDIRVILILMNFWILHWTYLQVVPCRWPYGHKWPNMAKMAIEPCATNMGKQGIPEKNYKNVAQQC